MILALAGLFLPAVAAWWVLRALRLRVPGDSRLLTAAVSYALGIGAASLVAFAATSLGAFPGSAFVVADAGLWVLLSVGAWWWARGRPNLPAGRRGEPERAWTAADWMVRAACVIVVGAAFAVPAIEYQAAPHGQWDAWAIWNQKARFLLRAGDQWTASLAVPWSAPGHPMLVSFTVARLWAYAGAELTSIPALASALYGATTLAVVMGALDPGRARAWVAGAVLVSPLAFSHLMAAQTADLAFAAFAVASLAMLRQDDPAVWKQRDRARSALLLSGLCGGLSAWTKNEGLVLLVASACLVAWVTVRHGRWQDAAWWVAGVAPVAAVVAYYKLVVAVVPPEYFAGAGTTLVQQLTSLDRHAAVWSLLRPMWVGWGGPFARWSLPVVMVAAVAMAVTPTGRSGRGVLAVVVMMLAGYYTVYILTPLDLAWLVGTTFERLVMQVWPALVMAALSVGRTGPRDSTRAAFAQGET